MSTPAEGVPEGEVCVDCGREKWRPGLSLLDAQSTCDARGSGKIACYRILTERLRARLVEVEAIANEPCANCGFPTEDVIGKPKLAERLVEVERRALRAEDLLSRTCGPMALEQLREQCRAAESRALQAEGAARRALDFVAVARSHVMWIIGFAETVGQSGLLVNGARARDALDSTHNTLVSGLPPLTGAPRVAPPTPAALVPKEEDK